jgi:lipopolysaccharide biosynthesis protein
MKLIAFYLPQFHEIPENNKWWGKGFTDWTNVKKSTPLFQGHNQPREPLNDNYYDLLDIEVMEWQSKVAQEHGIYGFCYYHYWFDGKLLLEKPLENMLNNKNVTIPFCFSWANEPWARTWDGKDKDVLMPQRYGNEKEWEDHFEYLLQFFEDERYIKENNKPLMVIYKTLHIPHVEKMCEYWNKLAIEKGFDGIYFVETLGGVQKEPCLEISKAALEFEPNLTMASHSNYLLKVYRHIKKFFYSGIQIFDYDHIWNKIFTRDKNRFDKKLYLGAFVDWDNTPRKGYRGVVFKNVTPTKFATYLKKQMKRSESDDYIFINAWNEWAEGAYLEPDKRNGFDYLEKIKDLTQEIK